MNNLLDIFLDDNINPDISRAALEKRKVRLIVKEQEVYIMNMNLPRVNQALTRKFIYQELCVRFKNTDSIMFDYIVTGKTKKSVTAAIYCFNWDGEKIIKRVMDSGAILRGVLPLQFYVLEKYIKSIKSELYGFAFIQGGSCYTLEINKGVAAANRVFKALSQDVTVKFSKNVRQVFHISLSESFLNHYFSGEYKFINLGEMA